METQFFKARDEYIAAIKAHSDALAAFFVVDREIPALRFVPHILRLQGHRAGRRV